MKGSDIKAHMTAGNISQAEVAQKAGIDRMALNLILNNKRKAEANEYFKICRALGVPMEKFFESA